MNPGGRRIHIARLELDLRGVAPETARAAAAELGPAISRAWATSRTDAHSNAKASTRGTASSSLADGLAQRIVRTVRGRQR